MQATLGFIEFQTVGEAQKAITKSGKFLINGGNIQISKHKPREQREREGHQSYNYSARGRRENYRGMPQGNPQLVASREDYQQQQQLLEYRETDERQRQRDGRGAWTRGNSNA
jgi:RNA recognition motif-containing protein